jgi:NDP-sugar pyrophosphorylase family protein
MDAMIFAAGLGTRLAPFTDTAPKALYPVDGVPVLERVARRLVEAGADRLIVNVHRFGDRIEAFLRERKGFAAEVRISREASAPLETGGGLLAAATCFRGDAPAFLHNVDVLTDLPLRDLYAAHGAGDRAGTVRLATLATKDRPTTRRLLVDDRGLLGRCDDGAGVRVLARTPVGPVRETSFLGIHVISPAILPRLTERGAFPILDAYLRLVSEGASIGIFDAAGCAWRDVGKGLSSRASGPGTPSAASASAKSGSSGSL